MKRLHCLLLLVVTVIASAPAGAQALEVVVEGVTGELLQNVRAFLSIERERKQPVISERRVRRAHAQAPEEIRRALQPFGYYRPRIEAELQHSEGVWVARYAIEPGPPVRIRALDLRIIGAGAEDPEFELLRDRFPIRQGDVLEHERYELAKRELRRLAADRGYLDAELQVQEVQVRLEPYEAQVALHFDTGPRYRFGDVRFEIEALSPAFLERYVPFNPGEPFASEQLFDLQTALLDSDYFAHVEVEAHRELAEEERVPVLVRLEELPRNRYTLGVGYGTDTGARASAGWLRRHVNRRGHRVGTDVEVSELRNRLTGRYLIPGRQPRTDQYALTASWLDDRAGPTESETLLLGSSLTRLRGDGWQETFALTYQRERFTVADETRTARLLMPGLTWARVVADDRIYTTRGWRLLLDLRGAAKDVASDATFAQARAQAAIIRSIGKSGRLIARTDLGVSAVARFTELPVSQRFFAGGDQSVRGFAFQSLGPTDAAGNVVGGRHLVVGSLEYEHRLTGPWSAAIFYDAGNAVNDFPVRLRQGAGLGVRWRSPVGLVRVDVASALDEPGTSLRLHLTIGPDL
jgi:translocation and assembly module TamA